MDLYLNQETPQADEEGSWRQLLQAQRIQPRLADPERFGDEPGEEILILERLKAARGGAVMSQPSLSVAAPPCAKSASPAEGFMLRPPPRGEAGSVLTRGGAMAGAPLAALRQRRGLHGASEDSEAALLADLDIRELLRRYT
ncbi:unnamed protein product [Symbiodinium sp. KB8]|nr:unnamed protein product [Symbiodinium sp. KB8]